MNSDASRLFEPFDISVLGAGNHVWVSAKSRQGSVFGVSRPRPQWRLDAETSAPAEWLTKTVHQARQVGDKAWDVGQVLNDLVFGEPTIANLFSQTRGVAAAVGAQLLVRVLAAPQEVSSWPWELLLDPQQPGHFLTMARDVHLVRAGRSRTYPVRDAVIEPPLNVLLVMSSPLVGDSKDTETPFDLWAEKRSLLRTLQPLVDRGLLNVVVEDRPTIERLRERMCAQRRGFHIVHYLGHANPYGLLLQQGNSGKGLLVQSREFAMLLQQMPDLRLVVFAGCETARAPAGQLDAPDRYSTADVCVRDACPMVVGMQAVLPFGTERIFTKFFYEALTGGQTVAQALRLARLAIADDGARLLNWAVPCLFVGDSEPGPLTNPLAKASPPAVRRQVSLKLGIRQRELRFTARLCEMRKAVDMLSGRNSLRLMVVIGPPESGKTSLLDRALEELDDGVASLFISAKRLLAAPDPVLALADLVAELITASGRQVTKRAKLDPYSWWERLLEDLARLPFALVIDDGDALRQTDKKTERLVNALGLITMRRGSARLAVVATNDISALTALLGPGEARTIRVTALFWDEMWQWIRRNLPVLTRIDKAELCEYYAKLPHLEQWERLAEEVVEHAATSADLPELVRAIAGTVSTPWSTGEAAPPLFGDDVVSSATPSPLNPHVLRVAVAGPASVGKAESFAARVTRSAAEHYVAGRMAGGSSLDLASSLAELLVIRTPFYETLTPSAADVVAWVDKVQNAGANVILVDFDDLGPDTGWQAVVDRATAENRLIVAVSRDPARPAYPARCAGVLAVGAPNGQVDGKPELVGPSRETDDTAWEAAVDAVEAAVLVWATDRNLQAQDLRRILIETAGERQLDLKAALFQVRSQLLLDALEWGPLELDSLLVETGMKPELVAPLLEQLRAKGKIDKIGIERYENPGSVHNAYKRLCLQQLGGVNPTEFQHLDSRVSALALRRRFTADESRVLWNTGDDGRRLIALVIIKARPDLGTVTIVADGIRHPRSPLEHLLAFQAAKELLGYLSTEDKTRLRAALQEAMSGSHTLELAGDRRALATELLDLTSTTRAA